MDKSKKLPKNYFYGKIFESSLSLEGTIEMATEEVAESTVKVPENSPLLGQNARMLELSWGVRIKSADFSENHCECCPNSQKSFNLSTGKEIVISGPIVKVYLFIDVLHGIIGIP